MHDSSSNRNVFCDVYIILIYTIKWNQIEKNNTYFNNSKTNIIKSDCIKRLIQIKAKTKSHLSGLTQYCIPRKWKLNWYLSKHFVNRNWLHLFQILYFDFDVWHFLAQSFSQDFFQTKSWIAIYTNVLKCEFPSW